MKNILKSIAIASATYVVLMLAVGLLNTKLPSPTQPGPYLTLLSFLIYLLPALISGYLGGRIATEQGLLIGLASCLVGLLIMGFIFPPPTIETELANYSLSVLIASLAGGVGELYVLRAKNA